MASILHYGGSFDPIHYGHLHCAAAVAAKVGFTEVVLVPGWQSPHKSQGGNGASADDRLAMCKLAATFDPIFKVDDLEIRRGGPSFTIDTVRALRAIGLTEVNWLIGADQLLALPRWREPESLVAEANLWVMLRPGYPIDWSKLPGWLTPLRRNVVNIPQIDISATDIRNRVQRGESIDAQVPGDVARYIEQRGLYR
jgi:nicotinate-nucleotide adenylyltransferase